MASREKASRLEFRGHFMSAPNSVKNLVERWQAGDEAAATELVERYQQELLPIVRAGLSAQLRQRLDPADILQSAFLSYFRRSRNGEYPIDSATSLWKLLRKIALNKIRRRAEEHHAQKRDVAREISLSEVGAFTEPPACGPAPDEAVIYTELVASLFEGLKPIEAEMMQLSLDGFTTTEIAARLDYSRQAVQRLLSRITHRKQRESENEKI